MNQIEKMIAELCPEGIEFKSLEDIFDLRNGYTPSKSNPSYWKNGTIPWFRMEDIRANGRILNDSIQYVHESAIKGGNIFPANSIIVATSATIGEHALIKVPHLTNQRFTCLSLKPRFSELFEIKFLFYYCFNLCKWCIENVNESSFASVNMQGFKKFKFPIPPFAIQTKIVQILDAMTALTSELTSELTARNKQYQYYREKLLGFDGQDVKWNKLGEVACIQRGSSPRPIANYITNDKEGVPWIKIGDTNPGSKYVSSTAQKITKLGAEKSRILNKGDFIISNSMSFGRPYILGISGAIHDGWASISDFEQKLNPDYLYHYLSSNRVQSYWLGKINSGSVSNLNADIIKSLPIPIPYSGRQKQIADILDQFDTLTTSLTEGLPREIALRQQQYEYYRDLLLSFPPPETRHAQLQNHR